MNLYFRLIVILLKSMIVRHADILDESRTSFRVWPFDCDINLHLTNARYFALADVSRISFLGQAGVLFRLLNNGLLPVAQAQEISFFKGIKPFCNFAVTTRFTHWDDKYWYTEHKFITAGQLNALLQVRGVFVQNKKVQSMNDVFSHAGLDMFAPQKPSIVEHWQKLLQEKKEYLESSVV